MLWAAACMSFFGHFRAGEVVVPSVSGFDPDIHLAVGDVRVDNVADPAYLEVRLKALKTDLCPVAAVLGYMMIRSGSAGPFFRFQDGRPLTWARFVKAVRVALSAAGVNPRQYSSHSFRIRAATTAGMQGVLDLLVKTLGRAGRARHTSFILCSVARYIAQLFVLLALALPFGVHYCFLFGAQLLLGAGWGLM